MFSSDGKTLAVLEAEQTVQKDGLLFSIVFWDTETWIAVRRLALTPPDQANKMTLGSDLKTAAFLTSLYQPWRLSKVIVRAYDATRNEQLFSIPLDANYFPVENMTFSPDIRFLALQPAGHPGKVIELASQRVCLEFSPVKTTPPKLLFMSTECFSPDGQTLAVAESDQKGILEDAGISLWDLRESKRQTFLKAYFYSYSLAFSPDGKLLASGGGGSDARFDKGGVTIWNWKDEIELVNLPLDHPVRCVAFSPDGKTLAYGLDGWAGIGGGLEFVKLDDLSKAPGGND